MATLFGSLIGLAEKRQYVSSERGDETNATKHVFAMPKNHVLNCGVLLALVVSTAIGWLWVWGIFFIFLSYQAYVEEVTFVVTPISKAEAPILYWIVSAFWFLIGASYLMLA